jgi:hypothetical protein
MKSNNTFVGHNSEHLCQVWLNSVQCFSSRQLRSRIWDLAEIELDLHIMIVNIVLKFQSPLQVIMVLMPIGNTKWSTAKVNIALKTYELHFRNILENH